MPSISSVNHCVLSLFFVLWKLCIIKPVKHNKVYHTFIHSKKHWQDTKIYHRWCMWKAHPCICHNSSWLWQCKSVRPTWQSTTSCSTYVQYSGENSHPNRKVGSYYTCSKTTSLATNISTHRLQDSTSNIQGAAWFSSSIYFQAHKATSYRSQYQTNGYKQTSSTSNESSYFWW